MTDAVTWWVLIQRLLMCWRCGILGSTSTKLCQKENLGNLLIGWGIILKRV